MRAFLLLLIVSTLIAPAAGGQGAGTLSFELSPAVLVPLGDSRSQFGVGGGGGLAASYNMPFWPVFAVRAAADLAAVPTLATRVLILVTATVGVGLSVDVFPWLSLSAFVAGGWGQGFYSGETGGSAVLSAQARACVYLTPSVGFTVGTAYRHYFSQPTPFYEVARVELGAIVRLTEGRRQEKASRKG